MAKKREKAVSSSSKDSLNKILSDLEGCTLCRLSQKRTNIVVGEGSLKADLMFVGEGPGEQEDLQARPFVGRSGQLLTKMIEALGMKREDVYIANVVKCRPPENRNPEPDEIEQCEPFLFRQVALIRPKVIVTLGKFAAQTLLRTETPIGKLRGRPVEFRGATLIPTWHPSYLLRNPSAKKDTWADLQEAAKLLGISVPSRKA